MSGYGLLLALATLTPTDTTPPRIAELDWLAGAWCGDNRGTFNEEIWMAPRDGSMVGMHRDTRAGKLTGFEYFRIVEDGDALAYRSQPGGAALTEFRARTVGKRSVSFVNPDHDYPKRIRYWLDDDDRLNARIDDGTDADAGMSWVWAKNCESPP
jgi:hypothetical protein